MAVERPQITDTIIERFINHVEAMPNEIRSTPESLFYSERRENGGIARIYMSPTSADGFTIQKAAFYHYHEQFPYLAVIEVGQGQHLELSKEGNYWLNLRALNGDEALTALYAQNGEMLEVLSFTRGRETEPDYIIKRSPRIYDALVSESPELAFTQSGISYNADKKTIEMPVSGGLVTARIGVNIADTLLRYFPVGLRQEPFILGPDFDTWAQSDWLADFGVDWQKVSIVKTPVFAPMVNTQNS